MTNQTTPEDIAAALIKHVFSTSKCKNASTTSQVQWRLSIGFRRFVALTLVSQPGAIGDGIALWKVAEAIGVSPTQLSRLCRDASQQLGGLKHPSMRSDDHRRACSKARRGVSPITAGKRATITSTSPAPANRYRASEQVGVMRAMQVFRDGGNWSKVQVRLLFAVGYVDEDGALTTAGIKELNASKQ